jgi:hypothetical protein
MCNYTIAKRCCLKPISFSPLSDFGDWGKALAYCAVYLAISVLSLRATMTMTIAVAGVKEKNKGRLLGFLLRK